jgi:hypothetical protein
MGMKQRVIDTPTMRMTLLKVATATTVATVGGAALFSTPVPTPTALLAESHRSVSLAAASSPYQLLQDALDTVLPAVVNAFGAKPTITLPSLLSQIPPDLLTDVLNSSLGTVNVNSLLGSLGLTTAGSSLNTAVSEAISSALSGYLSSATSGAGAAGLTSTLSSAIATAVAAKLNGLSITVNIPVLGNRTVSLATIIGNSGITNLANSVAGTVASGIVNNLTSILPSADELTGEVTGALPDLLTTVLGAANLTDASGNIQVGNLLNMLGLNLGNLVDSNALTVTTAGPLFTLARLFGGVDLGWVPGTETAIANSVNGTGYLNIGTDTLKTNLSEALSGVLSDGSLAASLGTALTPTLNAVVEQTVNKALGSLQSELQTSLNNAVSGLNYSVSVPFVGTVTIPVGSALQSAISPLIGSLAASLSGTLTGSVADAVDGAVGSATGSISGALSDAVNSAIDSIPSESIADVRIPIVVGTGLGAFSAGAAYEDVLAKLSSQPGGADYTGVNPLAGSLTLLPEILLNNAGRANGGILARFSSFLSLFGIDAVTPDVAVTSSGGTAVGNTGLSLGGANLIPVKLDATVEYQLESDFASWPDAFTLFNNVAAALLPTYALRGLDTTGALSQLTSSLGSIVSSLTSGGTADTNLYLTVAAKTLPLLEPAYLIGDVLKLAGLTPVGTFVDNLANALSPVLTSLVNLGYSDSYWNPTTGRYERTLDNPDTLVQFGTLPTVNWSQVLPNLVTSLVNGLTTAFTSSTPVPNAISGVQSLLDGGINGLLSGLTSGTSGLTTLSATTESTLEAPEAVTPAVQSSKAADTSTPTSVSTAAVQSETITEPATPEPATPEPASTASSTSASSTSTSSTSTSSTSTSSTSTSSTSTSSSTMTKAQRRAAKRAAAQEAAKAGDTATSNGAGADTGTGSSDSEKGTTHTHEGHGKHEAKANADGGDGNADGGNGHSRKHDHDSGEGKPAA